MAARVTTGRTFTSTGMAAETAQTPRPPDGVGRSWKQFLDGGFEGVSEAVVLQGGHRVKLYWVDGHVSEFSLKWLRDHSDGSFNVSTKQRKVDTFSISNDSRVSHASVEPTPSSLSADAYPNMGTDGGLPQMLRLRWHADCHESGDEEECTVPMAYLRQHCTSEVARALRGQLGTSTDAEKPDPAQVLWGKGVLSMPAGKSPALFEYEAIMEDDQQSHLSSSSSSSQTAATQLRGCLKTHGIALVRGVPDDPAATEALGLKLAGHLMSTMMGNAVYGISTETVHADTLFRDSAYTNGGLSLHTDHSFVSEPPGLQVLSCQEPASEGGVSTFVDGFAVAERLRKEIPEAFDFFTTTSVRHQYLDDGYHFIADGPIIKTDPLGVVVQVKYNEGYRAPLDYLSPNDIDQFYEHHQSLIAIMRDPSMVEHILLEKGDTMIFDNHRALHGRGPYKGWRRMLACYIGKDEANSEARMKGVNV